MRVLFQTVPNFGGTFAKAYSRNPYGEFEVRYFETVRTQSKWFHKLVERKDARSFESDIESACKTAMAMVYPCGIRISDVVCG